MKAIVADFNQEKALVGAFSVIVQLHRLIVYTALHVTRVQVPGGGPGAEERCPAQHSVPRAVPPHQLHGRPHAAGEHLCSSILPSILSKSHESFTLKSTTLREDSYYDQAFTHSDSY